jgi:hypothetical protein
VTAARVRGQSPPQVLHNRKATIQQAKGFALAMTKLGFTGEAEDVLDTVMANWRELGCVRPCNRRISDDGYPLSRAASRTVAVVNLPLFPVNYLPQRRQRGPTGRVAALLESFDASSLALIQTDD